MKLARALMVPVFVFVACALPNPNDLNLDGCMRACNATSQACLNQVNADLQSCIDYVNTLPILDQRNAEESCVIDLSKRAENCSLAEVNCIADCVQAAEKSLGKN